MSVQVRQEYSRGGEEQGHRVFKKDLSFPIAKIRTRRIGLA